MKSHTQVAVIGGGIIGCSILYHLTKLGWTDVVLLEKTELTAGSTWHAAANCNTFYSNPTMVKLLKYSNSMWAQLEEETGQSVGVHPVGGLQVAETPDRLDELKRLYGIGKRLDLEYEFLNAEETAERGVIMDTTNVLGAIYSPEGGHCDPYGLTHAYAKGAQNRGAKIYRNAPVDDLAQNEDGSWDVKTPKGTITAQIIVNAAGFRANEIAALTDAHFPMMAMEHMYVVTEPLGAIKSLDKEFPILRNPDRTFYMRREGEGLLVGTYEKDSRTFGENGIPPNFGQELLPPDLDRITPELMEAMECVPCFAEAGIKQIVNGPFCFSPDTSPLLGWMPGQKNHFLAAGFLAGINMSGGIGKVCAEWMVHGQPSVDMTFADVARYGDWANGQFELERAHEMLSGRYMIHFPAEEAKSGRPQRQAPLYERQKAKGAVFGMVYGWERPNWYAPEGTEPKDVFSFRRPGWFDAVGAEARGLRKGVGVVDVQAFSTYEISGPGAEDFLNKVMTNRAPLKIGRVTLTSMVNKAGGIIGDFTMTRFEDDRFLVVGSGVFQGIHLHWFNQNAPEEGVSIVCTRDETCGFNISGPNSRELMSRLADKDFSNEAFRFLDACEMTVAGIQARVMRVTFSGDLGFEIHAALKDQEQLYDAIAAAGVGLDMCDVGARALDSLRMEKGWGSMGRELNSEVTPEEVNLGFLVNYKKGDFIGRDALVNLKELGPRSIAVTLVIDDAPDEVPGDESGAADAWGQEGVWFEDKCVGVVTSGGYGHSIGKSLALAQILPSLAEIGTVLEVEILMKKRRAIVSAAALFDPTGDLMRS